MLIWCRKPQVQVPAMHKSDVMSHTCNCRIWAVETRESEIQGHLGIHIYKEFKSSLLRFHSFSSLAGAALCPATIFSFNCVQLICLCWPSSQVNKGILLCWPPRPLRNTNLLNFPAFVVRLKGEQYCPANEWARSSLELLLGILNSIRFFSNIP